MRGTLENANYSQYVPHVVLTRRRPHRINFHYSPALSIRRSRCKPALQFINAPKPPSAQPKSRRDISQAVLARCLNLTTGQVRQLERGAKHARGATLKLLCLIEKKGLEVVL